MSVKNIILNRPNWLASEVGLVLKTITVPANTASVTENGRKIVKSGTIFATPFKGLLFGDIDITDGAASGSLMVGGYYIDANLPATAASSVSDFAAQGLYPLAEGSVTRPDFGSVADLSKLSTPVATFNQSTKVIGWSAITGATGYELYKGANIHSTYGSDVITTAAFSLSADSGSYYLRATGDNLYTTYSEKTSAIDVTVA